MFRYFFQWDNNDKKFFDQKKRGWDNPSSLVGYWFFYWPINDEREAEQSEAVPVVSREARASSALLTTRQAKRSTIFESKVDKAHFSGVEVEVEDVVIKKYV